MTSILAEKKFYLALFFFILILFLICTIPVSRVSAANPCATINLITNGSMAAGSDPSVAANWNKFALTSFAPTFEHVDNEQIDPNGSQYIWADAATFDAGIYQTVLGLSPGTFYRLQLGYGLAAHDPGTGQNLRTNLIGRQVGIDLTGGVDPKSSNVIWGTVFYNGVAALNIPALSMTFPAQIDRVTVFFRGINTDTTGRNKIWFDAACLEPISPSPTLTFTPTLTPSPTPTRTGTPPTPSGTRVFIPMLISSGCAPAVIATTDVGGTPKGIAVDATTNRVYVSLFGASSVTFVDPITNISQATWWANNSGHGNGVGATNGRVFSAMHDTASVSILNGTTGAFSMNRSVGASPYDVDAANGRVWVANFGSGTVTVLDAATGNVVATPSIGSNPALVEASGDRAFVSVLSGGVVEIGNDGTVRNNFSALGAGSYGVAFNAKSNRLYVSNRNTNQISVINPPAGQLLNSITLSQTPYALAINPDTNRLYVVLADSNQVDVREGASLTSVGLISVGAHGTNGGDGIAVLNGRVYVSNNAAGTISVIQDNCSF